MWAPVARGMALAAVACALRADTLAGKVVEDHTGNPLASVEVRIVRTGARYLAADLETDTEGHFEAAGLPPGEYRIEAAKANYVTSTVRPKAGDGHLVVRLVRCGTITGQVIDGQSQPVLGAIVYALPKPAGGGPFRPFPKLGQGTYAEVDENGQYRLFNLPPGEYAVAVTYGASTMMVGSTGRSALHPGVGSGVQIYPSASRPQIFAIAGGEEYHSIDFALSPGALFTVSGKVEAAAKGAYWVALTAADSPSLAVAVTQSERDGTFKLEGIAAGSYHVTATGPSRARSSMGAVLPKDAVYGRAQVDVSGDTAGLTITPGAGRSVELVLQAQKSAGCPSTAQLTITPLEDWAAYLDRTVDVTLGEPQRLEDVAPARFGVTAGKLGDSCYQAATVVLDLTGPAPAQPVTVMAAAAGSVRGKLTGAATPADWSVALVAADPSAEDQPVQVAAADAEGNFRFAGLAPGRYRIAAQPAAAGAAGRWVSTPAAMLEIQVNAGTPAEIELAVKKQ